MSNEPIGPIRSVTISSSNIELAVDAYRNVLGFSEVERGRVETADSLAAIAPKAVGNPWVKIQAANLQLGAIVFVGGDYVPPETFRTLGWGAIEILVSDVDTLVERCIDSPFEVLIPPISVGSGAVLRAAQLRGPSGEGIYLTQILGNPKGFSLPRAEHLVEGIFIVVLAARELESSRDLLLDKFAARLVTDHLLPIRILNRAFDLHTDTLHRISSVQLSGKCVIETDQYPTNAKTRRQTDGDLPPGIAVVSVYAPGINEIEYVQLPDGAMLELFPR